MDILLYTTSLDFNCLTALRRVVNPAYTVGTLTATALASQPWSASCALLVIAPDDNGGVPAMSAPVKLALQQYLTAGGRALLLGLGASVIKTRTGEVWDPASQIGVQFKGRSGVGTQYASVRLPGGEMLAGLRRAGARLSAVKAARWNALAWWEPAGELKGEDGEERDLAAVDLGVGTGRIALLDVHLPDAASSAAVDSILTHVLRALGLILPMPAVTQPPPDLPSTPTHPLPQFLLAPPEKPHIIEQVVAALGLSAAAPQTLFADAADTFRFHFAASPAHGTQILATARQAAPEDGAAKDVVVLPPGCAPPKDLTPRFDVASYFDVLSASQPPNNSAGAMGEALLYSEAVTSTQTMLDKNPSLLAVLPSPLVSLASFQLAGRGRGSNTWLSPAGCLQFSLRLRVSPGLPGARLVFVQYLFGLAVVGAARDPRALGIEGARVKLKWPNDVYVEDPGAEKRKVGGILVNMSFQGGKVDVIVGCGLNISTPAPLTSLSTLGPLSMETMLALILSKFQHLWTRFLDTRGSWAPFEDDYLDAWMHSDQLVTVTTVSPPRAVRIIGITHDHGLLRTLPERAGLGRRSTADDGYIDLQPDGNSFDLMAGLIKTKK
ncbi:class II aaRS and biotin synthetase [Auriscalpium vulgare]|uniref:Class II aaRS and biotin synthetase n=1 Tax=Auriscalpium vulgare TaxID=40419 RepID=A0ACB8S2F6_9AGAM|nr:class II aaRS and biotin synthetase [Auriscalpium vulgare]